MQWKHITTNGSSCTPHLSLWTLKLAIVDLFIVWKLSDATHWDSPAASTGDPGFKHLLVDTYRQQTDVKARDPQAHSGRPGQWASQDLEEPFSSGGLEWDWAKRNFLWDCGFSLCSRGLTTSFVPQGFRNWELVFSDKTVKDGHLKTDSLGEAGSVPKDKARWRRLKDIVQGPVLGCKYKHPTEPWL
jgi:hypothetical protein